MEYENFMQAYLDNDEVALKIGRATETAFRSLVQQKLIPDSTRLWADMCSQAWVFHVKKTQEG